MRIRFSAGLIVVVMQVSVALSFDGQLPKVKQDSRVGKQKLGEHSIFGQDRVPLETGFGVQLPPLMAPTTSVSGIGNGSIPQDLAGNTMTNRRPLPEGNGDRDGNWLGTTYAWRAAGTYSHPLYFEDIMLERHGHRCKHMQSVVSGARFFTTLPLLPYLMTVQRPCDTYHSLGYYRPGTRAACLKQRPPFQTDAAIQQAAVVTGAAFLLP